MAIEKRINSKKFYTSYSKLSEIKLITIGLASPELIKQWAEKTLPNGKILGEVINANTLHHKTFKPQKGGLFCERIFGPLKDFECACGKPLKYKKEVTRNSQLNFLTPSSKRLLPFFVPTARKAEGESSLKKQHLLKQNKLNQITELNKTKSIFGNIITKTRNFCNNCEVEYTWSVIRRYQLGYINLISPVTHIWYLKGNPSYLSILLDIKKRHLEYITYCSETLTLENGLKGTISSLKSSDIVSSWKRLKKQIIEKKTLPLIKKINTKNDFLMRARSKIQKREKIILKKKNLLLVHTDLSKTPANANLSGNSYSFSSLFTNTKDLVVGGFVPTASSLKNQPMNKSKITSGASLLLRDSDGNRNNFVLKSPSKFGKNYFWEISALRNKFNLKKLKILSFLILQFKQSREETNFGRAQSPSVASLRGKNFFPKQIFKLTSIPFYILLNLNIFSQKSIIINIIDIIWNKLSENAYKKTLIRFKKIFDKMDCLIFNKNFFKVNKKKFLKNLLSTYPEGLQRSWKIAKIAAAETSGLRRNEEGLRTPRRGKSLLQRDSDGKVHSPRKSDSFFFSLFGTNQDQQTKNLIAVDKVSKRLSDSLISFPLSTNSSPSGRNLRMINSFKPIKRYLSNLINEELSDLNPNFAFFEAFPKVTPPKSFLPRRGEIDLFKQEKLVLKSHFYLELYTLGNCSNSIINLLISKILLKPFLNKLKNNIFISQKKKLSLKSPSRDSENKTKLLNIKSTFEKPYTAIIENLITIFFKNLLQIGSIKYSTYGRYQFQNFASKKIREQASKNTFSHSKTKISGSFFKETSLLLRDSLSTKACPAGMEPEKSKNPRAIISKNSLNKLYKVKNGVFYEGNEGREKCSPPGCVLPEGVRALLNKFPSPTLNIIQSSLKSDLAPLVYRLVKPKNSIYLNKTLYNNIYSLSHRERWESENDWNILYYYLSTTSNSASDSGEKIISNYKIQHQNLSGINFSPLYLSSDSNSPPSKRLLPFFKETPTARKIINNNNNDVNFGKYLKSAFFSGSGMVQQLLNEFNFSEIKKIDKQNRILLYQLNKQIFKLRKKIYNNFAKKEVKECYKKRDLLIRRTKLIRKLFIKESSPQSMILSSLPVLPPDLRPIVKIGGQIAASDLNRLYQRVIYRNDRLKKFLKDSATSNSFEMKYAQRLLQEAVDNLIQNGKGGIVSEKDSRGRALKSLSEILKGKQGRFRQYLLGKRVDYSGRSVIVVGPKLKLHECGLPKEMALELYLPFLLKRILNQNLARTVVGAKTLIKTNPCLIWQLLREIMQTCPVLLNRAPTLHRLGIQAFQPTLIEGRAILLHPLVCSAFNADFDGDQMAVHVPITVEARAEAWKLMLSRNSILAPSTGDPLAIPSQDMVLGCYYLTTNLLNSKINYFSKKKGSGFYFTNVYDALKAYELKEIDLHANIWLKWHGFIENGSDQEEPLEIRIDSCGIWKEISNKSQKIYNVNNIIQIKYIITTPGKILFNLKIQKCLA
jgi:DNA-directed RNA polymerase beta' subunit